MRFCEIHQLSAFSAIGQLVQSSNTMGQEYVGLFDEQRQCVLLVYWSDIQSGSTSGLFRVFYYPESGGSYYQTITSTTSFTRTGKIWWDPYMGYDGALYSSIDGVTMDPLAEVDNCSRVIKYVVTLGYRYSSETLMDVRIHDINVVADLDAVNPNAPDPDEPVECDGTGTPTQDEQTTADVQLSQAMQSVTVYWTG